MKRLLPVLLLLFSAGLAISQSVAPQVTASAGGHFTGANAQLSWTIGEVVIETFETETNQLTQGFHQTNMLITAVEDLAKDFQVKIFPNPTAAIMKIQWKETVDAMILSLYNHQGQQVMRQSIVGQVLRTY